MTTAVNIAGNDLTAPTNVVTLTGFDPTHRIKFSKPLAAASGGLLTWDAYSRWPDDSQNGGKTWLNDFSIYGNNGGGDVLLFNYPGSATLNVFATKAEAYAAIAAKLPFSAKGYATYKIVGVNDDILLNRDGLSLLVDDLGPDPSPPPTTSWEIPDLDMLAQTTRVGVLLRVATDPVIRLWSGQVRDLAIPSGGAETTDGAVYQSMGMLTGIPELSAALNGEAERVEFSVSGVAVTGEVAAIAQGEASDIRGVAVDVGLVLFDDAWQIIPPAFWLWSGTADSLTVERTGDAMSPTRTLKLSAGSVFSGRRRPTLGYFTDIDQRRRSADDAFFDQIAKLQQGTTKVWGLG